ncbi:hypothetical protein O6H91_03G044600 [Diphasiastrum complanatum]|nr:hypothetical protein O6H91_Y548500 [Diphasiastrum complanatum]KAJ7561865.1 hypothetical protein O6H91_03G044600 [Diphasiastrum complanatum]
MVNWFTFFCMVRTFSNCLETVLTTVALYYWPTCKNSKLKPRSDSLASHRLALLVAGLACAIRPTSAIIWLYVGVTHLIGISNKAELLLFELVPIGAIVFGATCLLDRWMYGKWVLVPINFIQYNFLSAGGDFYGSHPWHWYFTQGFPTMMLSMLPLMMAGIWWSREWWLAGLMLWDLGIYSILGHKEFRFVLPVLPLALMFTGYALAILERWKEKNSQETFDDANQESNKRSKSMKYGIRKWSTPFQLVIFGLLLTNIPVALYTSVVHQRGAEAVMEYLHKEALEGHVSSVMFLMPCHSTPYYSTLHKNVSMRFLDCSPSEQEGYIDEADRFMSNPVAFLSAIYGEYKNISSISRPSHLVLFDSLKPDLHDFLEAHSYKEVQKFFHSHFPVDRELQAYVLVYAETSRD